MSAGGLLLRMVLMLSLLLNGLNAAMAAPMALAMLPTAATPAAEPPCHGGPAMPGAHAGHHSDAPMVDPAQAAHDGDHGRIKDCLRDCAQQPSLTAQVVWLPTALPPAASPQRRSAAEQPTPPLDRITRPPIV